VIVHTKLILMQFRDWT